MGSRAEPFGRLSKLIHSCKPIVLVSQYGIGAVLSHILEGGHERSIAYISRTLSSAETHYSQLEKEALAILFAVTKFHNYLFGRRTTVFLFLLSDHRVAVLLKRMVYLAWPHWVLGSYIVNVYSLQAWTQD